MSGGGYGGSSKGAGKWGKAAKGKSKGQAPPEQKKRVKTVDGVEMKQLVADIAWKGRLQQALCATHKCVCSKETLVYTVEEEGEGFVCSISSDMFENVYGSEGVCASKKGAEENAAMVTMQAEFPAYYKSAPEAAKEIGADLSHEYIFAVPGEQMGRGVQKKKLNGQDGQGGQDPISKFTMSMSVVLGRALVKGDISYTVEDVGGSGFKATCTTNCTDPPQSFKGKYVAGKLKVNSKEAERSAATAALAGFQDEIDVAMPAHLAKKAAKLEEWEAKKAMMTAANEAAAEAPPAKKAKITPIKKK